MSFKYGTDAAMWARLPLYITEGVCGRVCSHSVMHMVRLVLGIIEDWQTRLLLCIIGGWQTRLVLCIVGGWQTRLPLCIIGGWQTRLARVHAFRYA